MSSLFDIVAAPCALGGGMIFLKKMFCETKTTAEPNAHSRPIILPADTSKLQASMTPRVRGRRDRYVLGLYDTPKSRAYAATVKRGDRAWFHRVSEGACLPSTR